MSAACPNCGAATRSGARFCRACGRSLEAEPEAGARQSSGTRRKAVVDNAKPGAPRRPWTQRRWLGLGLVVTAILVGSGIALIGAGSSDKPKSSSPSQPNSPVTTVAGTSTTSHSAAAGPTQPAGTITATTAGAVSVGMTEDDVRARFLPPSRAQDVNLGSSGPAPEVEWIWDLADGQFTVYFDNTTGKVAGFISTSPAFSTTSGVTVGSSFGPIEERYGNQIRLSPIGEGNYVLSEAKPGSYPALTFTVEKGQIAIISAGFPPPAGE